MIEPQSSFFYSFPLSVPVRVPRDPDVSIRLPLAVAPTTSLMLQAVESSVGTPSWLVDIRVDVVRSAVDVNPEQVNGVKE
ncbi:MAG: hypothetical protein ACXWP6_17410 [Ktedonobacterales bacterium]